VDEKKRSGEEKEKGGSTGGASQGNRPREKTSVCSDLQNTIFNLGGKRENEGGGLEESGRGHRQEAGRRGGTEGDRSAVCHPDSSSSKKTGAGEAGWLSTEIFRMEQSLYRGISTA